MTQSVRYLAVLLGLFPGVWARQALAEDRLSPPVPAAQVAQLDSPPTPQGVAPVPQPTRRRQGPASPVRDTHLAQIGLAFRQQGITGGQVVLDRSGRVELKGVYEDEPQVDRAFSIAQTFVGPRWVSPVTPDHIKVKQWEECLGRLMSGKPCGGPPHPPAQVQTGTVAARAAGPGPLRNKYALVTGTGRFAHGITPLRYANKDSYDFYAYLVDPAGGAFPPDNVILLRDENATRANIVRALDTLRSRVTRDDMVVLYFSSHGSPPDKRGGVHLVTHDTEVKPRERIWHTSVTDEILGRFVQEVPAQRLIVLMDTCYSNGAYAGIPGFLPPGGKSLTADDAEGYGRSSRYMAKSLLGAKELVLEDDTPPLQVQRDGWGRLLISASDGGEKSWESSELKNSVFTRYFIDGLRAHGGDVRKAFAYAKPLVRQRVKREKGQDIEQNPQLTASRREWDMSMAAR